MFACVIINEEKKPPVLNYKYIATATFNKEHLIMNKTIPQPDSSDWATYPCIIVLYLY